MSKGFLGWAICVDFNELDAMLLDEAAEVVEQVMYERLEQQKKWGNQNGLSQHVFATLTMEELGEVAKDINDITYMMTIRDDQFDANKVQEMKANLRKEWIQVAALAVQAVEALDKLK